MNKIEVRRFLATMEFFCGFLFGVAIFGAALVFLITPTFILAILFSVCVFAFFIFLMALVRYCIVHIKITQQTLETTRDICDMQEQIFQVVQKNNTLH